MKQHSVDQFEMFAQKYVLCDNRNIPERIGHFYQKFSSRKQLTNAFHLCSIVLVKRDRACVHIILNCRKLLSPRVDFMSESNVSELRVR